MEEAEELLEELLDCRTNGGVETLLDAISALVADCSYPLVRQQKNIDSFLLRCEFRLSRGYRVANRRFYDFLTRLLKFCFANSSSFGASKQG
ncbi:hypothetical protein L596_007793 [Steinernema carpocapsae]|uniref:Uncharacterized protein n=1 Tax=Steinernema carpocapsae TaxID=34508 RepID=A0A4U5PB11_STECR|nr:hypothetical protein L596_007793 [Steinernema carpocapsae]